MGAIWGNNSTSITPSYAEESFSVAGLFLPKVDVYGLLVAIVRARRAGADPDQDLAGPGHPRRRGQLHRCRARRDQGVLGGGAGVRPGIGAAGAGGAIIGVLYPFVPGSHYLWIARLLAIVVLGGMGSLNGAVLGAVLFGLAETLTAAYISPSWATAVPYLVVFAVLLIRPQGLLGSHLRQDSVTA